MPLKIALFGWIINIFMLGAENEAWRLDLAFLKACIKTIPLYMSGCIPLFPVLAVEFEIVDVTIETVEAF